MHIQVIGPYRSGKSFLLNQLLSLSCDEGVFTSIYSYFFFLKMFDIDSNSTTCDLNDLFLLQVLALDICVTQRQKVICA